MEQLILLETEFRKAIHQQKKLMKARRANALGTAPPTTAPPASSRDPLDRWVAEPAAAAIGRRQQQQHVTLQATGSQYRHAHAVLPVCDLLHAIIRELTDGRRCDVRFRSQQHRWHWGDERRSRRLAAQPVRGR